MEEEIKIVENSVRGNNMKNKFSEFYYQPDLEKLWKECNFVFDTNVFIDLYYDKKLCDQFLDVLENKISDRIWMPHQVGLEYYRNQFHTMNEMKMEYNTFLNKIKNFKKNKETISNKLNPTIDITKYLPDNIDDLIDQIIKASDEIILKSENNPDFFKDDAIKGKLESLFCNKVGDELSSNDIKTVIEYGEFRKKNKIPPGFKDNGHGDLILWHQILIYTKNINKPIILVTGDSKKDWWLQNKQKKFFGPHPSLIREFLDTGNEFYMYKLKDFLEESNEYLNAGFEEETIEIAGEIETMNEIKEEIGDTNQISSSSFSAAQALSLSPVFGQKLSMATAMNKSASDILMFNSDLKKLQTDFNTFALDANALKYTLNNLRLNSPSLYYMLIQNRRHNDENLDE